MAMPQNGARLKIKYARWACISNPFDILAYFMPPDFLSFFLFPLWPKYCVTKAGKSSGLFMN